MTNLPRRAAPMTPWPSWERREPRCLPADASGQRRGSRRSHQTPNRRPGESRGPPSATRSRGPRLPPGRLVGELPGRASRLALLPRKAAASSRRKPAPTHDAMRASGFPSRPRDGPAFAGATKEREESAVATDAAPTKPRIVAPAKAGVHPAHRICVGPGFRRGDLQGNCPAELRGWRRSHEKPHRRPGESRAPPTTQCANPVSRRARWVGSRLRGGDERTAGERSRLPSPLQQAPATYSKLRVIPTDTALWIACPFSPQPVVIQLPLRLQRSLMR